MAGRRPPHRAHHQLFGRHRLRRADLESAARGAQRAPRPSLRARARPRGRGRLHGGRGVGDPQALGPAGGLALRRHRGGPEAPARGLRGPRGHRLRRAGRGEPLLHVHLDDAPGDGGLRGLAAALRGLRSPQSDRRRRRGRVPGHGLPDVRRPASDSRPPRHDGRRARAALCIRAENGPRPRRLPGRGLDARDGVVRHGTALGRAVAQHADRGHGARVSGHVPARRHESLRGPGDDAALRSLRRAVARRAGFRGRAQRPRASGRPVSAASLPADVRQARRNRLQRRAAPRHRPRDVPAFPDGTAGHRGRAAPRPARLSLADGALRVRHAAGDRPAHGLRPLPRHRRARGKPARRDHAALRGGAAFPGAAGALPALSRIASPPPSRSSEATTRARRRSSSRSFRGSRRGG